MKNVLKLAAILLIVLCGILLAQEQGYAYKKGVPKICAQCGPCPHTSPPEESICICFEKLVFQTADVRSIYAFLADTANINIVVDPDLSIKISLKLENVSWCQFFSLLLDLYDLRVIEKGGYLYILAADKFWTLKFGEIDNIQKEKKLQDTETQIFRVENVDASNLTEPVKTVMSENGEIVIDVQSNSLIISDLPEMLAGIEAMIESLDVLGKQVKITCQIVQIDQSSINELGIDWSGQSTDGEIAMSVNMDQVGGAGAKASMGNFTWGIISGSYQFFTKLSAIISEGKGRVLDQPYIITMENVLAELFSGKQIPINTVDQAGNLLTQFYQVGTRIAVTPRITKDEGITLEIKIERSGYVLGAGGYEITTRTISTVLNVKSGDVVVIGGLITNEKQQNEYGVPIIKDIPLIGRLFTFESQTVNTSVITLFITPEIL